MSRFIESKSIAIIAVLAVAVTLPSCVAQQDDSNTARLIFEPENLEVRAASAEPAAQQVEPRLVNRTDRVIRILRIESGCGCTVPGDLETKTLAPGASVKIPLSVTPPNIGVRVITVRLTTDHPDLRVVTFDIKSVGSTQDLPKLVRLSRSIRLTGRRATELLSEELTVRTLEEYGSLPWVEGLTAEAKDLLVEPVGTSEKRALGGAAVRRDYAFRVSVPCPTKANQRREDTLTLQFAHSKPADVSTLMVNTTREPTVRLTPSTVNFSYSAFKAPMQRIIHLEAEEHSNWTIQFVEPLPSGFAVDAVEASNVPHDRGKRVRLSVDPAKVPMSTPTQRFVLPIKTSIPEEPQLELQVCIFGAAA